MTRTEVAGCDGASGLTAVVAHRPAST